MKFLFRFLCKSIFILLFFYNGQAQTSPEGIVNSEFIFPTNEFPECHASSIVQTKDGFLVTWFAGTHEKNPDVSIYASRYSHGTWSKPVELANGIQSSDVRYPCWNPVLFQVPQGDLLLFYKVGPDPVHWWGMIRRSKDEGKTWSEPEKLPEGILGPIKNKPVWLHNKTILCPTSTELDGWKLYFEYSKDLGKTWQKTAFLNDGKNIMAIQPSVLFHPKGKLQLLCRSQNDVILEAYSNDNGMTWSEVQKTSLPNPNSGTDAVTLKDSRHLLVYNHTIRYEGKWGGPRSPINVAISKDGKKWFAVTELETEPGEFSYPAVIQSTDGMVHIIYTWKRKTVKHVVLDPKKISGKEIMNGQWPK